MSGHSKWATIKHKKGAADQARGKLFAKIARQIEAVFDDFNILAVKLGMLGDAATVRAVARVLTRALPNFGLGSKLSMSRSRGKVGRTRVPI